MDDAVCGRGGVEEFCDLGCRGDDACCVLVGEREMGVYEEEESGEEGGEVNTCCIGVRMCFDDD